VAHTLARGLSLAGVVLVPATVLLVVLGPALGVLVFGHGRTTGADAHLTGQVLVAFGVGLVPFSAFQMQLRAWLAMRDSRTPMLVNIAATAVNLGLDVVLYETLPLHDKAIGLAAGYSASYVVGTVILAVKLRRRIVATVPTHVIRTHIRLLLAGVAAAVPVEIISRLIGGSTQAHPSGALLTVVLAGGPGLVVFVLIARRLRITELSQLVALVPGRGGVAP
jgi:putative peptidoglycan lipid II flippase